MPPQQQDHSSHQNPHVLKPAQLHRRGENQHGVGVDPRGDKDAPSSAWLWLGCRAFGFGHKQWELCPYCMSPNLIIYPQQGRELSLRERERYKI